MASTLVELIRHEKNAILVRDLDAYDGTPVLDLKPHPDWKRGRFIVVTDFKAPEWARATIERHGHEAGVQLYDAASGGCHTTPIASSRPARLDGSRTTEQPLGGRVRRISEGDQDER